MNLADYAKLDTGRGSGDSSATGITSSAPRGAGCSRADEQPADDVA